MEIAALEHKKKRNSNNKVETKKQPKIIRHKKIAYRHNKDCEGGKMKKFTDPELIALSGILKMESLGLVLTRVMKPLIDDEELKKHTEAWLLDQEGRIEALRKMVCDGSGEI